MPVKIRIPSMLRTTVGGATELSVPASGVRDALLCLKALHPALYRSVCDETDAVRRHIGLFVNQHHIRDLNGLDTPLAPGDVLSIFPAVSGGNTHV